MRLEEKPTPCPAGAWPANVLALLTLLLLPLYMPTGYVELVDAKFRLLLWLAGAGTVVVLLGWAVSRAKGQRRSLPRLDATWLPLPVLCLSYTIAWLMAEDRRTALWGLAGRHNGLVMLLACTALYLLVRRFGGGIPAGYYGRLLAGAGCVVTLLCWANFFMLDPLGVYYTFLPETGKLFLGPVGNINFYGAYLAICLPLAAWELMTANDRADALLWGAASVCLGSGLIAAGSDAAWLGAFCAVAVLCMARTVTGSRLARLCAAGAVWAVCALAAGFAAAHLPIRDELRTISGFVCRPWAAALLAIAFGAAALLLRGRKALRSWRFMRGLGVVLVLGAAAAVAAANLTAVPLGPLEDVLRFSDSWGSNRGFAWQRLWQVWRDDITPMQKLFGLGGDAVAARLKIDDYSIKYMILLNGETFDSAHNEYLQHLVCGGAVGLAAWLAFLVVSIRKGLRTAPGLAAAIFGYAVQAFFSISMPGVLPLVFVLAALCGQPRPVATRGWYRCLAGAAAAAPLLWMLAG